MKTESILGLLIVVSFETNCCLGAPASSLVNVYQQKVNTPMKVGTQMHQSTGVSMYTNPSHSTAARTGPVTSVRAAGASTGTAAPRVSTSLLPAGQAFNPVDRNYFSYDRTLGRRWFDLWETAGQVNAAGAPIPANRARPEMTGGLLQILNPYTFTLDTLQRPADNTAAGGQNPAGGTAIAP